MILARSRRELRERLSAVSPTHSAGVVGGIGLVPTMGYLHEGHLSLVDRARELSGKVAVSIFVNPLQFGPEEDLDRYPRDIDRDLALLEARGVDLCFAPDTEEMYPEGRPQVTVDPGPLGEGLCGAYRPGHFRGVLTVVARLFGLFSPEVAVFGRKDYQQAVLIRLMVRDLGLSPRIEIAPVAREEDGLALSSRNTLLSPEERGAAPALYQALRHAEIRFRDGERSARALRAEVREFVAGRAHLDLQYVEIVDPDTLHPLDEAREGSVLALAAFCGSTRLIDNLALGEA